ncbi:MAG: helix-turn-helix domain-containing protein [Ilumatobacteraceae bacterium]
MRASTLLKDLRLRSGLTQSEVAQRVGIPSTVVSAYERGRREPSFDVVHRLVGAMGFAISVDGRLDPVLQARKLVDVLLLAEQLPFQPKPLAKARLR